MALCPSVQFPPAAWVSPWSQHTCPAPWLPADDPLESVLNGVYLRLWLCFLAVLTVCQVLDRLLGCVSCSRVTADDATSRRSFPERAQTAEFGIRGVAVPGFSVPGDEDCPHVVFSQRPTASSSSTAQPLLHTATDPVPCFASSPTAHWQRQSFEFHVCTESATQAFVAPCATSHASPAGSASAATTLLGDVGSSASHTEPSHPTAPSAAVAHTTQASEQAATPQMTLSGTTPSTATAGDTPGTATPPVIQPPLLPKHTATGEQHLGPLQLLGPARSGNLQGPAGIAEAQQPAHHCIQLPQPLEDNSKLVPQTSEGDAASGQPIEDAPPQGIAPSALPQALKNGSAGSVSKLLLPRTVSVSDSGVQDVQSPRDTPVKRPTETRAPHSWPQGSSSSGSSRLSHSSPPYTPGPRNAISTPEPQSATVNQYSSQSLNPLYGDTAGDSSPEGEAGRQSGAGAGTVGAVSWQVSDQSTRKLFGGRDSSNGSGEDSDDWMRGPAPLDTTHTRTQSAPGVAAQLGAEQVLDQAQQGHAVWECEEPEQSASLALARPPAEPVTEGLHMATQAAARADSTATGLHASCVTSLIAPGPLTTEGAPDQHAAVAAQGPEYVAMDLSNASSGQVGLPSSAVEHPASPLANGYGTEDGSALSQAAAHGLVGSIAGVQHPGQPDATARCHSDAVGAATATAVSETHLAEAPPAAVAAVGTGQRSSSGSGDPAGSHSSCSTARQLEMMFDAHRHADPKLKPLGAFQPVPGSPPAAGNAPSDRSFLGQVSEVSITEAVSPAESVSATGLDSPQAGVQGVSDSFEFCNRTGNKQSAAPDSPGSPVRLVPTSPRPNSPCAASPSGALGAGAGVSAEKELESLGSRRAANSSTPRPEPLSCVIPHPPESPNHASATSPLWAAAMAVSDDEQSMSEEGSPQLAQHSRQAGVARPQPSAQGAASVPSPPQQQGQATQKASASNTRSPQLPKPQTTAAQQGSCSPHGAPQPASSPIASMQHHTVLHMHGPQPIIPRTGAATSAQLASFNPDNPVAYNDLCGGLFNMHGRTQHSAASTPMNTPSAAGHPGVTAARVSSVLDNTIMACELAKAPAQSLPCTPHPAWAAHNAMHTPRSASTPQDGLHTPRSASTAQGGLHTPRPGSACSSACSTPGRAHIPVRETPVTQYKPYVSPRSPRHLPGVSPDVVASVSPGQLTAQSPLIASALKTMAQHPHVTRRGAEGSTGPELQPSGALMTPFAGGRPVLDSPSRSQNSELVQWPLQRSPAIIEQSPAKKTPKKSTQPGIKARYGWNKEAGLGRRYVDTFSPQRAASGPRAVPGSSAGASILAGWPSAPVPLLPKPPTAELCPPHRSPITETRLTVAAHRASQLEHQQQHGGDQERVAESGRLLEV